MLLSGSVLTLWQISDLLFLLAQSHAALPNNLTKSSNIEECMTSLDCKQADIIRKFESEMKSIQHRHCTICHRVSLNLIIRKSRADGLFRCADCSKTLRSSPPGWLPTWTDDTGTVHYELPEQLLELREGEKLLLQIYSVYIPMHHLRMGAHGSSGHVCCFQQDIVSVCHNLPRTTVEVIRVIKRYKTADGEEDSHIFKIRRSKVMNALIWLKKYNPVYAHIEINEKNLDWMEGNEEAEIPDISVQEDSKEDDPILLNERYCNNDRAYGCLQSGNVKYSPSRKCKEIEKSLKDSLQMHQMDSMAFPFTSEEAVSEYDDEDLRFCKAFPWLFPGGVGDINSHQKDHISFSAWMKNLLSYEDGRFATDKMWCFYVLNVFQRKQNTEAGQFFVQDFHGDGPKTVADLQESIQDGDLSWIDRIAYFGKRVTGSAPYWRQRRAEVYSWINYHVYTGNGPPSLFITLSCAEYHWPDINRLVNERNRMAGHSQSASKEAMSGKVVNQYTVVIQEYFQLRVKKWLETIGKEMFGIQHYWLRFEFAPGRGQIHAHMLAIVPEIKQVYSRMHELEMGIGTPKKVSNCGFDLSICNTKHLQVQVLERWVRTTFGMQAMPPSNDEVRSVSKLSHPATHYFSDVKNIATDRILIMSTFQRHKCTGYCLRKRKHT